MGSIPERQLIITPQKKAGMPFNRRRPSLNSVVIKSIDEERVRKAMQSYTAELRQQHPEIERIIWFGSWVGGTPAPGSDVDLCLIITSSDEPARNRISKYLPLGFPVGVDLFVYTRDEIERLRASSPGWYRAIASGEDI
jgi:predicted nucleotidyltransferase